METTAGLLERTAQRMVADIDPVEAVVLFGSRARGTAHAGSDWDVAVLLDCEPDPSIRAAVPVLEHVNVLCKNRNDFRERALCLGTLESAIVRDGRVLAGKWERPDQNGERVVSNGLVRKYLKRAARRVESAIHDACSVLGGDDDFLPDVSQQAQLAAEFTSKAAMMHLGIDPKHVHDLFRLANQIEREKPHDPRAAKWAEAIRSMNGISTERHVGVYEDMTPDPLEQPFDHSPEQSSDDSLERPFEIVGTVTEFFAVVLRDITETRDGFARHAVEVAGAVEERLSEMRGYRHWEEIPGGVRDQLEAWNEEVQSIARLARSRTQQTTRGMGDPDGSEGTRL